MTSKDIQIEKQYCIEDLKQIYEDEIYAMNILLNIINSEEWEKVDFSLNLKKTENLTKIASKFDFKDCVSEKYIIAIKKLIKMAFEEGIQSKKLELKKISMI